MIEKIPHDDRTAYVRFDFELSVSRYRIRIINRMDEMVNGEKLTLNC